MINFAPAIKALLQRNTPVYVHYGITHRCNLTCAMCGLWKLGNKQEELNIEQIRDLASNLHTLGAMAVSLGGGEPFIREDLPEIVAAFFDRGIETRLLTNALAGSPELRKRVADTGLRHISISLDTPHPQVQSEICHKPEIWHDIVNSILYWSKIVNGRSGTGIINCVVSQRNLQDIPKMVKIAECSGFLLSLVPIETHRYQGKRLVVSQEASQMKFSSADDLKKLDEFGLYLQELKRKPGSPLFNSAPYLEGMISFLKYYCQDKPENKSFAPAGTLFADCGAGALSFSVTPGGRYSMCHLHNDTEGLKVPLVCDPGFVEWYRSRYNLKEIAQIRRSCRSCFRPCWWEIALSFSNPAAFANACRLRFRPENRRPSANSSQEIAAVL